MESKVIRSQPNQASQPANKQANLLPRYVVVVYRKLYYYVWFHKIKPGLFIAQRRIIDWIKI